MFNVSRQWHANYQYFQGQTCAFSFIIGIKKALVQNAMLCFGKHRIIGMKINSVVLLLGGMLGMVKVPQRAAKIHA